MKFQVRVKTDCSEQSVEEFGDRRYLVHLKNKPEDNKANIELVNLMGKHLGVPPLKLKIISGSSSKDKTLELV